MTLNWNKGEGWSSINAYQLPGIPFLFEAANSSSITRVKFPTASKYVEVTNNGSAANTIFVGFTQNGVNANPVARRVTIAGGVTRRFDVRVTEVWVLGGAGTPGFSVSAGLSSAIDVPTLSGSLGGEKLPHFEGLG